MLNKEFIIRNKERGWVTSEDANFEGVNFRDENANSGLIDGDIIIFPDEYRAGNADEPNIVTIPVGNTTTKAVIVDVISEGSSEPIKMAWYPNMLVKTVVPVKNGKQQPKEFTKGDAHDWYKAIAGEQGVNTAMNAMKGCRIKVSDSRPLQYHNRFQQNALTGTTLYTYSWVEGYEPKM